MKLGSTVKSDLILKFRHLMALNILLVNVEYRILNNECRSKVFCLFYLNKETERSESMLLHSKFRVRYSIFILIDGLSQDEGDS